jgi:ATP-dependent RNA helicase DeaD
MSTEVALDLVPCGLSSALKDRGFTALTAIQGAVLNPAVAGRDLRLSSKTGSGKTVAIGLVVAARLTELPPAPRHKKSVACPRALVVAPTRELAAQLGRELDWLYKPLRARLAVVTGGTSMGGDFRTLAACPHVLVGTPGRLVDHIQRGSLDLSAVRAVVLDEADEMLDMGFRDALELILQHTPAERATHLVSATFPRAVLQLANRYQRDAVLVEGSPAGAPNQDIAHVGLAVQERDKLSALVNVLLASERTRTLVFARTRAGTAALASELTQSGFSAAALSGDMGQRERTATLEAFRTGAVGVLVATDVAARGLDIEDIARVIHFDLPENDEVFTHRSGRTARAGNKGTSIVLVPSSGRGRVQSMMRRLGVALDWQPVPTPEHIRRAADARLLAEITAGAPASTEARSLAATLLQAHDAVDLVAALLARSNHRGPCEPRQVRDVDRANNVRERAQPKGWPQRGQGRDRRPQPRAVRSFTRFHVTWGASHGANPSRLLAMVCRRGKIDSNQVGAIKIADFSAVVEVASDVANAFAAAAQPPDPRNPKVRIRPWRDQPDGRASLARPPRRARQSA